LRSTESDYDPNGNGKKRNQSPKAGKEAEKENKQENALCHHQLANINFFLIGPSW
jgi:hypothetical protein